MTDKFKYPIVTRYSKIVNGVEEVWEQKLYPTKLAPFTRCNLDKVEELREVIK